MVEDHKDSIHTATMEAFKEVGHKDFRPRNFNSFKNQKIK